MKPIVGVCGALHSTYTLNGNNEAYARIEGGYQLFTGISSHKGRFSTDKSLLLIAIAFMFISKRAGHEEDPTAVMRLCLRALH